jgi:hypothetical protein
VAYRSTTTDRKEPINRKGAASRTIETAMRMKSRYSDWDRIGNRA